MGAGESIAKVETETQTEPGGGEGEGTRTRGGPQTGSRDYPQEILQYTPAEIKDMIMLYKEKQAAIDRSSIRGVQAKKDLYNALNKNSDSQSQAVNIRPKFDPNSLHRQNHPKGYLTKITTDYEAKHDEELTVQKGTMVKVLRNHKDGRYEVYTAGGFGLVPGKVLAYIQYEPDYS